MAPSARPPPNAASIVGTPRRKARASSNGRVPSMAATLRLSAPISAALADGPLPGIGDPGLDPEIPPGRRAPSTVIKARMRCSDVHVLFLLIPRTGRGVNPGAEVVCFLKWE